MPADPSLGNHRKIEKKLSVCKIMLLGLSVSEVKFEKFEPVQSGGTLNDAKEFKFAVPASPDYFTRFIWKNPW